MFAFNRAKARALSTGLLPVLAIVLTALLGACSSSKQPAGPQVFAWLQPEPPATAPIVTTEVEIEDDGLPAQTRPSASIRRMPDDPTAPWSPSYGRSGSGAGGVVAAEPNPGDDSWSPVTRTAGGAVVSADDEGIPVPKSPDEAGVLPEQNSAQKGGYLKLPFGSCIGWKCTP